MIKTNQRHFPWDVFTPEFYQSCKAISASFNIPLPYLGSQALFTIASLSGNMYRADINGGVKPIIYLAKIGPSSVGKTPPYHKLCGDIIGPLRVENEIKHKELVKQYEQRKRDAHRAKLDFDEDPPHKRIRIIEGGTVEAIAKHSITSPAGFGVVYDEGARMFGDATAYNKNTSAIDFWNEMFNGKSIELVRVDSDRERFIQNAGVSVDIGLQSDRLEKYFDEDTVQSGLLNRFLVVESDYIQLNENVDFFSRSAAPCEDWRRLVIYLFNKGLTFDPQEPVKVPFTDKAQALINQLGARMVRMSNEVIKTLKSGDASKYITAYRGKIFAYMPRLALVLAITENARQPIIDERHVQGAEALCEYYLQNATRLLRRLYESSSTGLTENERWLFDALPGEFTTDQANLIAEGLGLSDKFFNMAYLRKFQKGYIRKVGRGKYEKNTA